MELFMETIEDYEGGYTYKSTLSHRKHAVVGRKKSPRATNQLVWQAGAYRERTPG